MPPLQHLARAVSCAALAVAGCRSPSPQHLLADATLRRDAEPLARLERAAYQARDPMPHLRAIVCELNRVQARYAPERAAAIVEEAERQALDPPPSPEARERVENALAGAMLSMSCASAAPDTMRVDTMHGDAIGFDPNHWDTMRVDTSADTTSGGAGRGAPGP